MTLFDFTAGLLAHGIRAALVSGNADTTPTRATTRNVKARKAATPTGAALTYVVTWKDNTGHRHRLDFGAKYRAACDAARKLSARTVTPGGAYVLAFTDDDADTGPAEVGAVFYVDGLRCGQRGHVLRQEVAG